MIPEDRSYKDSKLLDLALYIDENDPTNFAKIGIEFKWTGFTKQGLMRSHGVKNLIDDFKKISMLEIVQIFFSDGSTKVGNLIGNTVHYVECYPLVVKKMI